jgi:hypothetical protein
VVLWSLHLDSIARPDHRTGHRRKSNTKNAGHRHLTIVGSGERPAADECASRQIGCSTRGERRVVSPGQVGDPLGVLAVVRVLTVSAVLVGMHRDGPLGAAQMVQHSV